MEGVEDHEQEDHDEHDQNHHTYIFEENREVLERRPHCLIHQKYDRLVHC